MHLCLIKIEMATDWMNLGKEWGSEGKFYAIKICVLEFHRDEGRIQKWVQELKVSQGEGRVVQIKEYNKLQRGEFGRLVKSAG